MIDGQFGQEKFTNTLLVIEHERAMEGILQKVSIIRDHVNYPWKLELIFSDRVKWDKVCASMDVLSDTQLAIENYFRLKDFSAYEGGYLFLYGLLQAFFMQQDAASNLSEGLFGTLIKWDQEYPDIHTVRELRNNAIGHPTKRGNNDSFHYISAYSLNKQGFSLASYYPKKHTFEHQDIDLVDLRERHEWAISQVLTKTIILMENDLKNHKNKFKDMKLVDLLHRDHSYSLGKVFEGIHNNYPLAEMNFKILQKSFENIVTEIDKRYTTYRALGGTTLTVDSIKYIFSRLETWIQNGELYKNKDAEIFLEGYRDRYKELEEMLKELDNDFVVD